MPRGDGTGPAGMGSMTGRAAGYCAGYNTPGFMSPIGGRPGMGFGRGMGRGMGLGRGWRFWNQPNFAPYYSFPSGPSMTADQETDMLRQQADALKEQLQSIEKRLGDLEKEDKKASS